MSDAFADLERDLVEKAALPECSVCRKKSDPFTFVFPSGAVITLCGTHFDEWLRGNDSFPRVRLRPLTDDESRKLQTMLTRFVNANRPRYAACWEGS